MIIQKQIKYIVLLSILCTMNFLNGMDDLKIEIISQDGLKSKIKKNIAVHQSILIKNMIEESDDEEDISIPLCISKKELVIIQGLFEKAYALRDKDKETIKKAVIEKISCEDDLDMLYKAADYLSAQDILSALAFDFVRTHEEGIDVELLKKLGPNISEIIAKEYFLLYKRQLPIIGLEDVITKDNIYISIEQEIDELEKEKKKDESKYITKKRNVLKRQLSESKDFAFEIVYPIFLGSKLHKIQYRNFTLSDFNLPDEDMGVWDLLSFPELLLPALFDCSFKNEAIENVKKKILERLSDYVSQKAYKKDFHAWFNKAKKIPGFVEKIVEYIWEIANNLVTLDYWLSSFKSIEENFFKFAIRVAYYQKYKVCIDDVDVSRIFGDDYSDKSYNTCFEDLHDVAIISIVRLKDYFSLGSSDFTFDDIANMFLYLVLGEKKDVLQEMQELKIFCPGSGLTRFPDALYNSTTYANKVVNVSLFGNKIDKLYIDVDKLSNIKYLDLTHNNFRQFPSEVLRLKKLHDLRLRANGCITSLPTEIGETKIKKLDIRETGIKNIPQWKKKITILCDKKEN